MRSAMLKGTNNENTRECSATRYHLQAIVLIRVEQADLREQVHRAASSSGVQLQRIDEGRSATTATVHICDGALLGWTLQLALGSADWRCGTQRRRSWQGETSICINALHQNCIFQGCSLVCCVEQCVSHLLVLDSHPTLRSAPGRSVNARLVHSG